VPKTVFMCDNRDMGIHEGRSIDLAPAIGATLRAIRRQQGVYQADLAHRCALGRSQLSYYETGRALMNIDTLLRILDVLAISPSDFFRLVEQYSAGTTPPELTKSLKVREALGGLRTALDRLEAAIDHSESP
jgi:transcriptional regulator with XRE-family HTH domain